MSANNVSDNGEPKRPSSDNLTAMLPPSSQTQPAPPFSQEDLNDQAQQSPIWCQSFNSLQFTQTSLPHASFSTGPGNDEVSNAVHDDAGLAGQLLASGHIPASTQAASSPSTGPNPDTSFVPTSSAANSADHESSESDTDESSENDDSHLPHQRLLTFHIFNNSKTLEVMLRYYQKTHHSLYREAQTSDNIRIHLATPDRSQRDFLNEVDDTYEDEQPWDRANFNILDGCFEDEEWDIDRLDGWFVREMARSLQHCLEEAMNGIDPDEAYFWPTILYNDPAGWQGMVHFLEWFKNELAPENWETSIVPDLLLLRGNEDIHDLEHSHDNCGKYAVKVGSQVLYHPMMSQPSPLITDRSTLIFG